MSAFSALNNAPELARKLQCFPCGKFFMMCECKDYEHAQHYQFMLDEADLPARNAPSALQIEFWCGLVALGLRTQRYNAALFYQEEIIRLGTLALMQDPNIQQQFYSWIAQYVETEYFTQYAMPSFPQVTAKRLKKVPKEGLDSFFAGRWYELCGIHIMLIMNAVYMHGPDPDAPSSVPLRRVTDAIQAVEKVLQLVSDLPQYSICAPERLTHMKKMAAYKSVV